MTAKIRFVNIVVVEGCSEDMPIGSVLIQRTVRCPMSELRNLAASSRQTTSFQLWNPEAWEENFVHLLSGIDTLEFALRTHKPAETRSPVMSH